ncbi:MAG: hypothetical protein IID05_02830 [Gemmatimonadetes bacterium]|nr:hypothetical protein [Gemmatimonadota bacterium]
MESNGERPEFRALEELEEAVRQVSEELAGWRKRAHRAEGSAGGDGDIVSAHERVVELESENENLRHLIEQARTRVTGLLTRLRFLEEQTATAIQGGRR